MRFRLLLGLAACLGCADVGLGAPGTGPALPPGGVPPEQTIEGGAQLRISAAGFTKITSAVPALVNQGLATDLCIPKVTSKTAVACYLKDGRCAPGCHVAAHLDFVQIAITNQSSMVVTVQTDFSTSVSIDPGIQQACVADARLDNAQTGVTIELGVDPSTGTFSARVASVATFDATASTISGCALVLVRDAMVQEAMDSFALVWTEHLTKLLGGLVGGFLPEPSELAAVVDLSRFAITGPAAGAGSPVETRLGPGGYARFLGGGLSVGMITGFNHDGDPSTRTAGLASEPDACAAGLTAPDLGASGLSRTARGTFQLPPAAELSGQPERADDLVLGISETALDLAGHHVAAGGGLCLTTGKAAVPQLRQDVLDDLLGLQLAASEADLRLVMAPEGPLDFSIGDGSAASPHLSARVPLRIDVEVDDGGFTPAFRVAADVGFGLWLSPRTRAQPPVALELLRSAPGVREPQLQAFDARYAGADPSLAATAVDLALGATGQDTGPFLVPGPGFLLTNVRLERIATSVDTFLAVLGDFTSGGGPGPGLPAPQPVPSAVTVSETDPPAVRTALTTGDDAGLPEVTIALAAKDAGGRDLEHTWRTPGGAWHPYAAGGELHIRDRTFAWQGARTLDLMSRLAGDESTRSPIGQASVVIDWAPPFIFEDRITFDGTTLDVPARDAVSPVEWALGRVGEADPSTSWTADEHLAGAAALALGNVVVVHVRDTSGHVARATVRLRDDPGTGGSGGSGGSGGLAPGGGGAGGSAGGSGPPPGAGGADARSPGAPDGCGCEAGGRSPLALLVAVGLTLRRRRRHR